MEDPGARSRDKSDNNKEAEADADVITNINYTSAVSAVFWL